MGGGQPSNVTQTNVQQLPAWLNNANTFGSQQAQTLYNTGGPGYYPGNTVAPFSPMQEQYFSGVENLAQNNLPSINAAQNYTTNVLNGQYLNPASNPYLQATFQQGANAVQNQIGSEFEGSGRNPQASIGAQADQMNDLAAKIYGGAYNTGIQQMQGALQESPAVAQESLVGLNALGSAGGQLQQQTGNMINANQNLYNYYSQLPYTNLANYMDQVNSLSHGATSSSTQPFYGPSKGENALGGAAAGAAAGTAIMPGWGTAIGAGIGLLGGYFG